MRSWGGVPLNGISALIGKEKEHVSPPGENTAPKQPTCKLGGNLSPYIQSARVFPASSIVRNKCLLPQSPNL